MDEGKVFVANLSKGWLSEDGSALLGALLLPQIELQGILDLRPEKVYNSDSIVNLKRRKTDKITDPLQKIIMHFTDFGGSDFGMP